MVLEVDMVAQGRVFNPEIPSLPMPKLIPELAVPVNISDRGLDGGTGVSEVLRF